MILTSMEVLQTDRTSNANTNTNQRLYEKNVTQRKGHKCQITLMITSTCSLNGCSRWVEIHRKSYQIQLV